MAAPLKKSISLFTLTMIAVGSCIGSGIFISPSDVASQLSNGHQVIFVWLIGGVVALTGALSFGELASRFPGTGGVYTYLKEAYGDFVAFLYGWSCLTVICSGAIAALCIAFARYIALVFHLAPGSHVLIGLLALCTVTFVNIISVKWSAIFSSLITVLKVIGISVVILVCLFYGRHVLAELGMNNPDTTHVSFGLALIGVLWSYGGWQHASYLGGEVHNAKKILPRAMVLGALIVTVVYILVNLAYLSVLSIDEVSSSTAVASDALMKISVSGGIIVAILIALSTYGTASIYTLSAPRIYFKMGDDKVFFSWLSDIHGVFGTPVKAILLQSFWAGVLLLFWGTFENLVTYVVFMDWIFMTMAAIALFVFRNRFGKPSKGEYKVRFFPLVPLVFIVISTWFLGSTLVGRPEQAIAGLLLVILGLPFYLVFKRSQKNKMEVDV
jgi:APA family basic amino acid/polyamine antiporter